MEFANEEKLALVKMADYVILANNKVAPEEMTLLTLLVDRFNFDSFYR